MGYEAGAEMLRKGAQAWMVLMAAILAWLFGGDVRGVLAAGREWLWPTPEAERVDEAAERVHAETEALLARLEPDCPVLVARRYLSGEMTADVSSLGAATARRLVAMRVQGMDPTKLSDQRIVDVMYGRDPEALSPRTLRRVDDAMDVRAEPVFGPV